MANWEERTMSGDKRFFRSILRNKCNFISNMNHPTIRSDHLCIFSKHAAIEKAEKKYVKKYIHNQKNVQILNCNTADEESDCGSYQVWHNAGRHAKMVLHRSTKLEEFLAIYNNMKVAMTYNEPGIFDQGQLAIVRCSSMTQQQIDQWDLITILISSIGTTIPPEEYKTMSNEDLLQLLRWNKTKVKKVQSMQATVSYNKITRRSQYPFVPHNGMTIHKILGDMCNKGVSQVSDDPN